MHSASALAAKLERLQAGIGTIFTPAELAQLQVALDRYLAWQNISDLAVA